MDLYYLWSGMVTWPGKRQINHLKQLILKIHEKSRFGYRLNEAKRNILRQVVIVFEFNIDKNGYTYAPGHIFIHLKRKWNKNFIQIEPFL